MQHCRLFLIILALFSAHSALAEPIVIGEFTSLHSNILDEQRRLMVSLPDGYADSDVAYPVLYVLDGMTRFHHTLANIREMSRGGEGPEMIVVGVINTDRTRDLTPAQTQPVDPEDPNAVTGGGGADTFIRFFAEELIPHVDETYRTVPMRVLEGHSFGGLFAMHAMIQEPELFRGIIAVSPGLWWDEGKTVERAAELFRGSPNLSASLYMSLGDEGGNMQMHFQNMKALLEFRSPADLRWQAQYFPDENHGSVPMPSVHRGLKHVFARWAVPGVMLIEGLGAVDQHFAQLSREYGYSIATPEALINRMGYMALGAEDHDVAVGIFRVNMERYPDSANVYDSLAEGLEKSGDLEQARDLYRKAWKLAEKSNHRNTEFYKANHQRVVDALAESGKG